MDDDTGAATGAGAHVLRDLQDRNKYRQLEFERQQYAFHDGQEASGSYGDMMHLANMYDSIDCIIHTLKQVQ